MQTSLLLLVKSCCCVWLCARVCAAIVCNKAAVNAAADLTLYFLKHQRVDYMDVPDIEQSFLKNTLQLHARNGKFGRVHSVERVDDFGLEFTNEKSNNPDKPTSRKIYSDVKAKFSTLHISFNDSIIKMIGCKIKGTVSVTVKNNLFEALTVSSDKKNCLMDIRLVKFHEFGPIDFQIDASEGKWCAAMTSSTINAFNHYFSSFTKRKMRQLMIEYIRDKLPSANSLMCVSPLLDVVFV